MSQINLAHSYRKFLYRTPFFAVLIPFISGILLSQLFPNIEFSYIIIFSLTTLGFTLFSAILGIYSHTLRGISLCLFILAFGLWVSAMHRRVQANYSLEQVYARLSGTQYYPAFQGIVTHLDEGKNGTRAILEMEYLYDSLGLAYGVKGGVLVYLAKTDSGVLADIAVGSRLLVKRPLGAIKRFSYSFDYASYLRERGIFFSTRLQSGADILWHSEGKERQFIDDLRNRVRNLIERSLAWPETANFVKALFMGERTKLDTELKQAYQVSGIMHIMAISGLHIGTLFLFFNYLFSALFWPWRHRITVRLVQASLLITLLAIYGVFVLGGPSIFRSVLMFSLLALAQIRTYGTASALNTLFLSALLILCFQPQALQNIGFLLSYFAVLALIVLMPLLEKYVNKGNKIIAKIKLILISSAVAQFATLPILLSTFTHFSTYFLIGNLLAIPLIALIMPAIVIMLLLGLIYVPLASLIGLLIHYALLVLNKCVIWLASLPYSYLFIPYFGFWQSLGYYLFLISLVALWGLRAKSYRIYVIYAGLFWLISFIGYKFQLFSQQKIYLHRQGFLEYIYGNRGIFFSLYAQHLSPDSTVVLATKQAHLLKQIQFRQAPNYWYNSQILLINSPSEFQVLQALNVPVVVFTNFSESIFSELTSKITCSKIVLLNYVKSPTVLNKLIHYCQDKNITLYRPNSYQLLKLVD